MSLLSCQPIEQEPTPAPAVNHAPRIVEDFIQPADPVIRIDASKPHACDPIYFSVGQVEDIDVDQKQTIVERWVVDLQRDPDGTPITGSTKVLLTQLTNTPSFFTDPENAFTVVPGALPKPASDPNNPTAVHTVQVFVSDGFDAEAKGDLTPLKGHYVVSRPWVIYIVGNCP